MRRKILITFTICLMGITILGCASLFPRYGTFVPDEAVRNNFLALQMAPDMNYYFSGSDLYPNIIMGLNKQYVLDNKLWQPISDRRTFEKLVSGMADRAHEISRSLAGFEMRSPEGRSLGVWYSLAYVKMIVEMGEGNRVVVFTDGRNVFDQDSQDRD